MLTKPRRHTTRMHVRLTTVGGRGLTPGVTLDDTARLSDLTEDRG